MIMMVLVILAQHFDFALEFLVKVESLDVFAGIMKINLVFHVNQRCIVVLHLHGFDFLRESIVLGIGCIVFLSQCL